MEWTDSEAELIISALYDKHYTQISSSWDQENPPESDISALVQEFLKTLDIDEANYFSNTVCLNEFWDKVKNLTKQESIKILNNASKTASVASKAYDAEFFITMYANADIF